MVQKGQFWRAKRYDEHVWVAFIFHIEGNKVNYLEYIPNGVVPIRNDSKSDSFREHWEQISPHRAQELIGNMPEQDSEYAYRMGKRKETENLAAALKILENKRVSSVSVGDNCVKVSTENGAEYEISFTREGYKSRQTGLPDPW